MFLKICNKSLNIIAYDFICLNQIAIQIINYRLCWLNR